MRHIRSFAAALVVALAGTSLAACGSSATKSTSGSPSVPAAAKPPAKTVAQALAATSTTLDGYHSVTMKLTASQGTDGTTTLAGRVGLGGPLAEDITVTAPPQEARQLGEATMQMKLSSAVMYMNMGPKMAAQLQGKHWMKIDMNAASGGGAAFKGIFDQSAGTSPATQLNLLLQAPGMKRLGDGTVNGVQAVHYGGTVDLKAITDKALAGDSALKRFVDASVSSGLGAMQVDVWVDNRNLPVEIHETGQTSQGRLDTTVDYSGFSSSPLTVTPPPASDTFDISSLASSGL